MTIEEIYPWELAEVAHKVFGTIDVRHPLVAEMHRWDKWHISGRLQVLWVPKHHNFQELRLTPAQTRTRLVEFGYANVVAFQTRNPLHRVHEELTKRAAQEVGGVLLLHPDEECYEEVSQIPPGTRTASISGTQVREQYLNQGTGVAKLVHTPRGGRHFGGDVPAPASSGRLYLVHGPERGGQVNHCRGADNAPALARSELCAGPGHSSPQRHPGSLSREQHPRL